MNKRRKPRAIDLYAGVGGWSFGLKLAGIDVVASYELSGAANETNFKNNHHLAQTADVRGLTLADLPPKIDIVVGSPPCTQFSFSNRGGNGDINDGLQDIIKFLSIVGEVKPRAWVMENVPRLAKILEKELREGGKLAKFAHLAPAVHVVNMAEYGLPQRRRRCLAGNFDFKLLQDYRSNARPRTMGQILAALAADRVTDPLYGCVLSQSDLTEHVQEDLLDSEEVRINRASKTAHIVYNAMPFPDPSDKPVRTITATCTRVSRESIVIEAPGKRFRRLTLREKSTLQGFPITFQFYARSLGGKLQMVGNAIPPFFAYLVGHAFQGTAASEVPDIESHAQALAIPRPLPPTTPPSRLRPRKYSKFRSFRFALTTLHLKSGVRFELRNRARRKTVSWSIDFYFGTPKRILQIPLNSELLVDMGQAKLPKRTQGHLDRIRSILRRSDISNLQKVWCHNGPGGTQPFALLDTLDDLAQDVVKSLASKEALASSIVRETLARHFPKKRRALPGAEKLQRNSTKVLAGLLVGAVANSELKAVESSSVKQIRTKSTGGRTNPPIRLRRRGGRNAS